MCKYIVYDEKGGAGICGNIITVDGGAPLQAIQVEAVVEEARKNEIERPPLKRERENEEEKDGRKEMCYKCKHRVNTDDDATGRQYMEFNLQNENTFKIKKEAARHIPHWSRIIADMEKNQIWVMSVLQEFLKCMDTEIDHRVLLTSQTKRQRTLICLQTG